MKRLHISPRRYVGKEWKWYRSHDVVNRKAVRVFQMNFGRLGFSIRWGK